MLVTMKEGRKEGRGSERGCGGGREKVACEQGGRAEELAARLPPQRRCAMQGSHRDTAEGKREGGWARGEEVSLKGRLGGGGGVMKRYIKGLAAAQIS